MTPGSDLILPRSVRALVGKTSQRAHNPGLSLDKLCWAENQEDQARAIDRICECAKDEALLNALIARRTKMLAALGAWCFHGTAVGSLTLHLSRANALENAGIALHPVYGFARLPGSGLKGLTRAWAETVWKLNESDQQNAETWIEAAFGTSDQAGRIVFHDAWPVRWPELQRDIVNAHHSEYYKEGGEKQPPRDREDPVPVYFLAIAPGTEFEFALSDRLSVGDGLLERAVGWVSSALEHGGVGAKTAAGYGRIVPCDAGLTHLSPPCLPDTILQREYSLTLAAPAFLAGAKQDQADCDMRPASLRGLLRWWWRTLHAAHLRTETLAQLEALIWGDTQRRSAVRLSLRAEDSNSASEVYEKKKIQQTSSLPRSQNKETVQGLFYASYGMDEKKPRWYRQPGDSWTLTLTVHHTRWKPDPKTSQPEITIPAEMVLQQARAALWLLTRFGGLGSKSRKGFGSFWDVSVDGIEGLEDCIATGQALRDVCGLRPQSGQGTGTPALERCLGPVEVKTPWKDPWFALDRVGQVYQRFVKDHPLKDRAVFGLPRKGLNGVCDKRCASPAHWSLSPGDDQCLTVRLIVLPDHPPGKPLEDLAGFVERELHREVSQHKGGGSKPSPSRLSDPPRQLESGQAIQAELLAEKTRKGGWKAKDIHTGIAGNIQNSAAVPPHARPGQEVRLIVKIPNPRNAAFQWPTPDIEERSKSQAPRNRWKGRRHT